MSILSLLLATSLAAAPTAAPKAAPTASPKAAPKAQAPTNSPTLANSAVSVMTRVVGLEVDPSRVGDAFPIDALVENVGERGWFRLLEVYMVDIGKNKTAFMTRDGLVRLHLAIDPGYHYVIQCEVSGLEGRRTRLKSGWTTADGYPISGVQVLQEDPGNLITTVVTPRTDAVEFSLTIDPLHDARHGNFGFSGCLITPIAP